MLKISLLSVAMVLNVGVMIHAMDDVQIRKVMNREITLPSQDELKQSLRDAGFKDFVSKVKVHRQLNRSPLSLIHIVKTVDQCIQWYDDPSSDWITDKERVIILKTILCKSPRAYEDLCDLEQSTNVRWAKL